MITGINLAVIGATLAGIRDGLLLNVIMLAFPVDAIRDWQSAITPT